MRVRARKDDNHIELVAVFRTLGFSVMDTASLGNGCPDLMCARNNQTWAIEIKDGNKMPSQRKLTPDEIVFKDTWKGRYALIESVADVLALVRNI